MAPIIRTIVKPVKSAPSYY